jgi:hypothetical protein
VRAMPLARRGRPRIDRSLAARSGHKGGDHVGRLLAVGPLRRLRHSVFSNGSPLFGCAESQDGRVTVDGGSKTFARDAYGAPGPFGVAADGNGEIVALSKE